MTHTATVTRRAVLRAAAAGVGAAALVGGWTPIGRLSAAEAAADAPPNLPAGVTPYLEVFQNWAGDIATDPLWTVAAGSEATVVALANWAARAGWRLRPSGFRHNWSPLTVADGAGGDKVLIVDTRTGLTDVHAQVGSTVTVGAGASMDTLLTFLDLRGRGLAHVPAVGDITVGGALAVGAHGAGIPAARERRPEGFTYGSLSNLVTSLRAVVWDAGARRYVAREFSRADPEIGALLVNLGRAFVTRVTLRVGPRQRMRCQSLVTVPIEELMAPPGRPGRTTSRYLDRTGRLEIIWFPFTRYPWLKVWTVVNYLPIGSIPVLQPYNYAFADGLFGDLSPAPEAIYENPDQTRAFAQQQASGVQLGLALTLTGDIVGSAANVQRYVRPSTMKVTANGYAILCRRADIQWVLNTFYTYYSGALERYAARGLYPVNGPMEIRVTGIDDPSHSGVRGAVDPLLSPTRRRPDRPDWDCVVYLDLLTLPETPGHPAFYQEVEEWLWSTFESGRTTIRAEWSKGWAYTASGPYTSRTSLTARIPAALSAGQRRGATYADAVAMFTRLDPNRIYSAPLLDVLLPG